MFGNWLTLNSFPKPMPGYNVLPLIRLVSAGKPRHKRDEHLSERIPEGKNTIVPWQMPAQRPVALLRVTVKPDVFYKKVLKGAQQRVVPVLKA